LTARIKSKYEKLPFIRTLEGYASPGEELSGLLDELALKIITPSPDEKEAKDTMGIR
jgi:hypothetical protein